MLKANLLFHTKEFGDAVIDALGLFDEIREVCIVAADLMRNRLEKVESV